ALANDAVRIAAISTASCAAYPLIPWRERDLLEVSVSVALLAPPQAAFERRMLAAIPGSSDVTPPAITGVGAERTRGSIPILRPGEALRIGFSEALDPRTLVSSSFALSGPTAASLTVRRGFGLSGEDVALE